MSEETSQRRNHWNEMPRARILLSRYEWISAQWLALDDREFVIRICYWALLNDMLILEIIMKALRTQLSRRQPRNGGDLVKEEQKFSIGVTSKWVQFNWVVDLHSGKAK